MAAIQVGRIVTKTMGREAGERAVIAAIIDKNFVLLSGAGISKVRRRRANIDHVEPMDILVDIAKEADDATIKAAVESNADAKKALSTRTKF